MAISGLSVPVPTLFDAEGALDPERNRRFAEGLSRAGVDHLFGLGSLGEFPSVEEPERRGLLVALRDGLKGSTDLWVGIGAPSTRLAVRHAREADDLGAAALVAVPPYYLAPTESAIADYYRSLAGATGTPLLAYNIPSKVGYALRPELVHALGRDRVLAGVKDTAGAIASVRSFLSGAPEGFVVFPGDDALVLESMRAGAAGGVMGTANAVPRLGLALVRAARDPASKEADHLQSLVDRLAEAQGSAPFPSSVKFLARHLRGAPDGYRPPYGPLTDEEEGRLVRLLEPVAAELEGFLREP